MRSQQVKNMFIKERLVGHEDQQFPSCREGHEREEE